MSLTGLAFTLAAMNSELSSGLVFTFGLVVNGMGDGLSTYSVRATSSSSSLAITYGPDSNTAVGIAGALAHGPGSQTAPTASGDMSCYVRVFWSGSSQDGSPTSARLSWATEAQVGYAGFLSNSRGYVTSGSVTGSATVQPFPGSALSYNWHQDQMVTTWENPAAPYYDIIDSANAEVTRDYNFVVTRDPEDGYYYSDIPVSTIALSASASYAAPTHGDIKDNSIETFSRNTFRLF